MAKAGAAVGIGRFAYSGYIYLLIYVKNRNHEAAFHQRRKKWRKDFQAMSLRTPIFMALCFLGCALLIWLFREASSDRIDNLWWFNLSFPWIIIPAMNAEFWNDNQGNGDG